MLGGTAEEILLQPIAQLWPSAPVGESPVNWRREALRQLETLRSGEATTFEFPFIHSAGHVVWTLMSCSPLLDAKGEYVGALRMVTDITARKAIEAELWEWKGRY